MEIERSTDANKLLLSDEELEVLHKLLSSLSLTTMRNLGRPKSQDKLLYQVYITISESL